MPMLMLKLHVADLGASARFYATVLAALGHERARGQGDPAWGGDFSLTAAGLGTLVTRGLHIGFVARTPAQVDAFWQAGVAAGWASDGEPGPRPEYRDDYYGAFLLDPDGNSAEAVVHGDVRDPGCIDHLWIRVADVARVRDEYAAIADESGFALVDDDPGHAFFRGDSGTFSLVRGEPTVNLDLSFRTAGGEVVRAGSERG